MRNRSTLFSTLLGLVPLKENAPLIGMGAAILAAFLALAGAAWSFDCPYFLCSALFSVIYYFLLYFIFFLDVKYSIYAQTVFFFQNVLKKEEESIKLFQRMCFLLSCFFLFLYCYYYFLNFSDYSTHDLLQPLHVVSQLSLLFFLFKFHTRSDVRERHLSLICFVCCIIITFYLKEIHFGLLASLIFLFCCFIYLFNLDYVPLVVLLFYSLDAELAKWGFHLLFQQIAYYTLSISLDKKSTVPQKTVIFTILFFLYIQLSIGLFVYNDLYLKEPSFLVALLSGASILFLCIKKREPLPFFYSFSIFFICSIIIAFLSSLGTETGFDFVGCSIFLLVLFLFLWGLHLFILPHEKQATIPFLFYTLFYILPFFPHLEWISKWIEGFDLLLFLLSFFSFIEEKRASHGRIKRVSEVRKALRSKKICQYNPRWKRRGQTDRFFRGRPMNRKGVRGRQEYST